MNKTYQIVVVQAENGFIIQSPSRKQFLAKDEGEVQSTVKDVITEMLKPGPPPLANVQTVRTANPTVVAPK